MSQDARDLMRAESEAEVRRLLSPLLEENRQSAIERFKATLARMAQEGTQQWRVTVLYEGLGQLLKAVVRGEVTTEEKIEAAEILNGIDRSLGRPEKHPLKIKKEA